MQQNTVPISQSQVDFLAKDYERVMGQLPRGCVCPLMLEDMSPNDMVAGHVLNSALRGVSRVTVPVCAALDRHYGTMVEAHLVDLVREKDVDLGTFLRHQGEVSIVLADGTEAEGFFAGKEAASRWPELELVVDGTVIERMYVRLEQDHPALQSESVNVQCITRHFPLYLVAALLKSAYLAMFRTLGYRAVDGFGARLVQQDLKRFYADSATRNDLVDYFSGYSNALQILGAPPGQATEWRGDTLNDRRLLFHFTPTGMLFAVSPILNLGAFIAMVAMPAVMRGDDELSAWKVYDALMKNPMAVKQRINRVEFRDNCFSVDDAPLNIAYSTLSEAELVTYRPIRRTT